MSEWDTTVAGLLEHIGCPFDDDGLYSAIDDGLKSAGAGGSQDMMPLHSLSDSVLRGRVTKARLVAACIQKAVFEKNMSDCVLAAVFAKFAKGKAAVPDPSVPTLTTASTTSFKMVVRVGGERPNLNVMFLGLVSVVSSDTLPNQKGKFLPIAEDAGFTYIMSATSDMLHPSGPGFIPAWVIRAVDNVNGKGAQVPTLVTSSEVYNIDVGDDGKTIAVSIPVCLSSFIISFILLGGFVGCCYVLSVCIVIGYVCCCPHLFELFCLQCWSQ
jgi:hypothetical protein